MAIGEGFFSFQICHNNNVQNTDKIMAIDLGTASISAAIAARPAHDHIVEKPQVIKVLRYPFNLGEPNPNSIFINSLNSLYKDAHGISKEINTIIISFSSPLLFESDISKKIVRKNPSSPISKEEYKNLLDSFKEEARPPEQKYLTLANTNFLNILINGYKVPGSILGYTGKVLELTAKAIFISKFLKEHLDENKEKFFPRSLVSCFSNSNAILQVVSAKENSNSALVFDIGGETTSLYAIDPGMALKSSDLPFGVRTLERRVAAFLSGQNQATISDSESLLRKFTSGILDSSLENRIERILTSALDEWWGIAAREIGLFELPAIFKKIFVTGGGADFSVFSEAIKKGFKKNYNIDADIGILSADLFKDDFISGGLLAGGSDLVLASLLFYGGGEKYE